MSEASVRARNLAYLHERGFSVADTLPVERDEGAALRPPLEIARRLLALDAVFTWAAEGASKVPSEKIMAYVQRNALAELMTPHEQMILSVSREEARTEHGHMIGWLLENMWPLAWCLGFEERPTVDTGMIDERVSKPMYSFLPTLDGEVREWLESKPVRAEEEVMELEDLFYCAHNAVRSAQGGGRTVPKGFHPVADGGVVHERRHALTWATSPGDGWDETDLST